MKASWKTPSPPRMLVPEQDPVVDIAVDDTNVYYATETEIRAVPKG